MKSPQSINRALNVQTISQSGMLYAAMLRRERINAKKQRRREKLARIRRFFFSAAFLKSAKESIGRGLAKMTYSLWKRGYFKGFDEFSTPRSA